MLSLDMLSRLKGIETDTKPVEHSIRTRLDMLSRLKGIETEDGSLFEELGRSSLDMLSRLKGIETNWECNISVTWCLFGYAFPFEGN